MLPAPQKDRAYHPPQGALNILHEGPGWLAINKPSGLLSVAGRGPEKADCAVSRMAAEMMGSVFSVHRLDMDTSGILLLATTKESQRLLFMQFEQRQIEKGYQALLHGVLRDTSSKGTIELPLRFDRYHRPYQRYDPIHGKMAITHWHKLGVTSKGNTRVALQPRTGRTHQLRVHMAHALGLHAPIAGDRLYGLGTQSGKRLYLHARLLQFRCPRTARVINLQCPVPF